MSWTVLRVVPEGVVLRDAHAARFAHEPADIRKAFDRFCAEAGPGIYAVRSSVRGLTIERRERPWLEPAMPTRLCVSPVAHLAGLMSKAPSPSPWDAVRERGICTLLTSDDGTELFEACGAALASWQDGRLIFAPADRPRVASTAEKVLRASVPFEERRLEAHSQAPLVALNAVSGAVALALPGRAPMPATALEAMLTAFRAATRR